jgi:hypothetical protein
MSRFHLSFTRDDREGSQVLRDPAAEEEQGTYSQTTC